MFTWNKRGVRGFNYPINVVVGCSAADYVLKAACGSDGSSGERYSLNRFKTDDEIMMTEQSGDGE
jgi:hypothetical protein